MASDNGHRRIPVEVIVTRLSSSPVEAPQDFARIPPLRELPSRRPRSSLGLAVLLFLLTLVSTLAVGAQFALAYASNQAPFTDDFMPYGAVFRQPRLLLLGVPFSFTLLGILLAHELGHYFACRYYRISASYPYFLPAPTIIGTLGAFIRIRSPIVNRTALFDVGLSGPVVGFLFAVPALATALAYSKIVPGTAQGAELVFGDPPLVWLLAAILHPGVAPADILLHPVGRAAWVGLFATAFNLLPAGQLDGGHILYALASDKHRQVSFGVVLLLIPLGLFVWAGWLTLGLLLLLLGFRHPRLLDRREPLDRQRRAWAGVAVLIFLLCFMPAPFNLR